MSCSHWRHRWRQATASTAVVVAAAIRPCWPFKWFQLGFLETLSHACRQALPFPPAAAVAAAATAAAAAAAVAASGRQLELLASAPAALKTTALLPLTTTTTTTMVCD